MPWDVERRSFTLTASCMSIPSSAMGRGTTFNKAPSAAHKSLSSPSSATRPLTGLKSASSSSTAATISRHKQRRRPKDPNLALTLPNSFFLFKRDYQEILRQEVSKRCPGQVPHMRDINLEAKKLWDAAGDEFKDIYRQIWRKNKEERIAMTGYMNAQQWRKEHGNTPHPSSTRRGNVSRRQRNNNSTRLDHAVPETPFAAESPSSFPPPLPSPTDPLFASVYPPWIAPPAYSLPSTSPYLSPDSYFIPSPGASPDVSSAEISPHHSSTMSGFATTLETSFSEDSPPGYTVGWGINNRDGYLQAPALEQDSNAYFSSNESCFPSNQFVEPLDVDMRHPFQSDLSSTSSYSHEMAAITACPSEEDNSLDHIAPQRSNSSLPWLFERQWVDTSSPDLSSALQEYEETKDVLSSMYLSY